MVIVPANEELTLSNQLYHTLIRYRLEAIRGQIRRGFFEGRLNLKMWFSKVLKLCTSKLVGICAWIKLRILNEKKCCRYTVSMVTAHNIDFKRTIYAQLFSITVSSITLKLSKIITDIYISWILRSEILTSYS